MLENYRLRTIIYWLISLSLHPNSLFHFISCLKMYLTTEKKQEIFSTSGHAKSATDTGSAESQIALFTYRISHLTEHLKVHKHDYGTQLGLLKLVGKRRRLLNYLLHKDITRYRAILAALGLRK
jgi:small subunit ribosomal protein S15